MNTDDPVEQFSLMTRTKPPLAVPPMIADVGPAKDRGRRRHHHILDHRLQRPRCGARTPLSTTGYELDRSTVTLRGTPSAARPDARHAGGSDEVEVKMMRCQFSSSACRRAHVASSNATSRTGSTFVGVDLMVATAIRAAWSGGNP
jgi:hypothetical protein